MRIKLPPTFDDDQWPDVITVDHERVLNDKPVDYLPIKAVACQNCVFVNDFGYCREIGLYVEPDHFCSWGERSADRGSE